MPKWTSTSTTTAGQAGTSVKIANSPEAHYPYWIFSVINGTNNNNKKSCLEHRKLKAHAALAMAEWATRAPNS